MLTSIRRNNMALPTESNSADSMFDFFDDRVDTTVNPVEHLGSDKQGATDNHQPVNNTLSAMFNGTSGRQITDSSFQSIEEVIELASDSNNTPELKQVDGSGGILNVDPVRGSSGKLKVVLEGGEVSTPETYNRELQVSKHEIVAPEHGRNSVISLLSDISLSENKSDEEIGKTDRESNSNIDSKSNISHVVIKPDTCATELKRTTIETQDNSSLHPASGVDNELSFTWLESELSGKKSPQEVNVTKLPPESNLRDTESESSGKKSPQEVNVTKLPSESNLRDTENESSGKKSPQEVNVTKLPSVPNLRDTENESSGKKSPQEVNVTKLPSVPNLRDMESESSGKKSPQEVHLTKLPSESNLQDKEDGFYSLDNHRNNADLGNISGSVVKENTIDIDSTSTTVQTPTAMSDGNSDLSSLTSENDFKTAKPDIMKDTDMSWLTGEKDAERPDPVTLLPSKSHQDGDYSWLKPDRYIDKQASQLNHNKQKPSETVVKEAVSVNWLKSDKEMKNEQASGIANTSSDPIEAKLTSGIANTSSDPIEAKMTSGIANTSSDPIEAKMASGIANMSWFTSDQDHVEAGSISDISQTSSRGATLMLQSTEAIKKHDLDWFHEKEKGETTLAHRSECSPGTSPNGRMSTPKYTDTYRRQYNVTRSESVNNEGDILKKDGTPSGFRGEPKYLTQMKDLNFEFMATDTAEEKVPTPALTGSRTSVNLLSPSVNSQVVELSVDDKKENDTKKPWSNKTKPLAKKNVVDSSEVGDAIHSAITLFHHEKVTPDVDSNKTTVKQKRNPARKNGSQQTNIRKKSTKKATKVVNSESEIKEKKVPSEQNAPVGKSKKSQKVSSEDTGSFNKRKPKKKKLQNGTETRGKKATDNNVNSSEAAGSQQSEERSASSGAQTSTMASSDTTIKVNDVSSYSLAYEDDFEEDTRSIKSVTSSNAGFNPNSQGKDKHTMAYSSTPYGGIYAAYARQPKQSTRNENVSVKFPKINSLNPVQLTSGQSSFSEQSFSAAAKRKRKSKRKGIYTEDSYEFKASTESNNKPEIIFHKNGRVPMSLKAEAVYRNGKLEIAVVDDRSALSESANMDVKITVLHKHFNEFARNRPRKLPKLNFATNRDILNHRAAYPPFNTHTDQQASDRFKQTFGT